MFTIGEISSKIIGLIGFVVTTALFIIYVVRGDKSEAPNRKSARQIIANIVIDLTSNIRTLFGGVAILIAFVSVSGYLIYEVSSPPSTVTSGRFVILNYRGSESLFWIKNDTTLCIYDLRNFGYPRTFSSFRDASISCMAVDRSKGRVYLLDTKNGILHVMNYEQDLVEEGKKVYPKTPGQLCLSADGAKLYVAITGGGGTSIQGTIHVLDATSSLLPEISVIDNIGFPESLFIAGDKLIVASQGGLNNDPVYVINTRTDKVIKRIHGFTGPLSRVIATHDNRTLFVTAGDNLYYVRDYMTDVPEVRTIPINSQRLSILSAFFPSTDTASLRRYANMADVSFSAMVLTPDDKTLLIGSSLAVHSEYSARRSPNYANLFSGGVIMSFDVDSCRFCDNNPMPLESAPEVLAIADDGELLAPLPSRVVTGDSYAMECSKMH